MEHANGTTFCKETAKECLSALRSFQDQFVGSESQVEALKTVAGWLERLQRGSFSEDEEPLDENSRVYLQSYRDQFTRFSLFERGHGELVGDSPKVAGITRERSGQWRNPALAAELEKVEDWDAFDVFKVAALTGGRPLQPVAMAVLNCFDLVSTLRLPEKKLQNFLRGVEDAYLNNPYHNSTHAADVVQGLAALFANNPFTAQLTDLEMLSMILACVIHDVGHPGVTNEYLINTNADSALLYNDQSINENGHAAVGMQLLRKSSNNFIEALPDEEYRFVRRTIIGIVLATDMVGHAKLVKDTTANLRQLGPDLQKWPEEKKQRALQMIVHCCDIGNPAKPLKYSLQWTERIMAENFAQGDRERREALPVSPLCDRERVDVPKSQLTFLEYVVRPCFEALRALAPETAAIALRNIEIGRRHWEEQPRRNASSTMFPLDDLR
ncbi:g1434 [Coccomyxa elongata]